MVGPTPVGALGMALFKSRSSLLEVQNRALMKTAKERAAQIDRLERELQSQDSEQADRLGRELQILQERAERQTEEIARQTEEIKRLTLERDFYSKRASALEQENRELTESATKYSVHAQSGTRSNRGRHQIFRTRPEVGT
jgi:predicted  nucleic acid-binding Zn-ribbon protein